MRFSTDARIAAVILALVGFSLAGCGRSDSDDGSLSDAPEAAIAEPVAEGTVERPDPGLEYSDSTEIFRGTVILGVEVSEFTPCGMSGVTWVRDRSGGGLNRASRELGLEEYQSFYVELRGKLGPPLTAGPGAGYGSLLTVEEVLEASADITRCDG